MMAVEALTDRRRESLKVKLEEVRSLDIFRYAQREDVGMYGLASLTRFSK